MTTWIALLRGVNVGGKNKLPMAELRSGLERAGFDNPRTYIQSGNVVFESALSDRESIAEDVAEVIEAGHGFRPAVWVVSLDELRNAIDANPFAAAADTDAKTVHYFFLADTPSEAAMAELVGLSKPSEQVALGDDVIYLHAPEGIGRSKLVERIDRVIGNQTTARNHRTATAIVGLAEG